MRKLLVSTVLLAGLFITGFSSNATAGKVVEIQESGAVIATLTGDYLFEGYQYLNEGQDVCVYTSDRDYAVVIF